MIYYKPMRLAATSLLLTATAFAQSWTLQTTNTTAGLRAIQAVDDRVVWASGTAGTFLRTTDAGATWTAARVPGAESLDFRGLRAIDARTAFLMSIGPGEKSRIYKTTDAGVTWTLQFTHPDPKGFLDSIAFWDADHGIVVGDALEGAADIRTTADGGAHWQRQKTPPALPGEGSFAASNTCVVVRGTSGAWFVTGGTGAARVFYSADRGQTWTVAPTPIRSDSASAGIFSIAFADANRGIVVGGDYSKDKEDRANVAITADGGRTWTAPASGPHGFRSAIVWVAARKMWIATGTSGSDVSADGQTWKLFDEGSFNALTVSPDGAVWAAGGRGRIAKLRD
jgi:photosystem II stability/assembly factor-like uncharacterized protein